MKKILYTLSSLSALLVLMASCSDRYTVTGTSLTSVYDGKMAYLRQMDSEVAKSVDSCEIVHGSFDMNGPLDSVMCVKLDIGGFSIPIVLEKGDIKVSTENSAIKVGGTPLNDKLYQFLNSRDSLIMLLDELPHLETEMILEGTDHDQILLKLGGQEADLRQALDKLETSFVVDNFDNILGVTWFLQLCNIAYQTFGYATTTPQIDELYGRAPDSFRNRKEIRDYMNLCK